MACRPYLKYHVHNKLTGSRRVYLGIASLVYSINLITAPCFDEVGLSGQRN